MAKIGNYGKSKPEDYWKVNSKEIQKRIDNIEKSLKDAENERKGTHG